MRAGRTHRRSLKGIALGLSCAAAFMTSASAGSPWLSFDPPGGMATAPYAINSHNLIVGGYMDNANSTHHAFLRMGKGEITTFDAPGASEGTTATCINDKNDIAGIYSLPTTGLDETDGFVRHPDGTFETFHVEGSQSTFAKAINNAGTVVGYATTGASQEVAFFRGPRGGVKTFLTGAASSRASAVNNNGEIIGRYVSVGVTHGFIREPGGAITTIDPPDSIYTAPGVINDKGEIAGTYQSSDYMGHGFLREPDGTFVTFDVPGALLVQGPTATGIDPNGNIAGYYNDFSVTPHGFVRDTAGGIHQVDVPGEHATFITGISPAGRLIGYDSSMHGVRAYPRVWQQH